jgi:hypothetical protein
MRDSSGCPGFLSIENVGSAMADSPRQHKPPARRQQIDLPVAEDDLLEATTSVPWERPVHAARLAFLKHVARSGELSVHVACGTDRLGCIDVACGLTTILTDIDAASLRTLGQQITDMQARLSPLPGSWHCRQLAVEAFAAPEGFAAGSVQHLTLLNLFNAHIHPPAVQPRIMDILLTVVTDGGSVFITESEAAVLARQARVRGMQLSKMGQVLGYYDEDVLMFQMRKSLR